MPGLEKRNFINLSRKRNNEMNEHEEIVFYKYTLSILGKDETYDLITVTPTATEVLKRLEGKVAGRKITEINSISDLRTDEERVKSIKTTFSDDNGGCKVCGQFNEYLWACTGVSEVAILACTVHKLYEVIQTSTYRGNEIDHDLLWVTWDDICENMNNQNHMIKMDGELLSIAIESSSAVLEL